jgi:serpin B
MSVRVLPIVALALLTAVLGCDSAEPAGSPATAANTAPVAKPEPAEVVETPEAPPEPAEEPAMNPSQQTTLSLAFASASNQLSFRLLEVAGGEADENFSLSGPSIELALAMTAGGARGDTLAQLREGISLAEKDDPAKLGQAILAHWAAEAGASKPMGARDPEMKPGVELRPANRLYGERSTEFESAFLELTRTAFGAPLEKVDFKGNFDGARKEINAWVAEQTREKIIELLPERSLDSLTRMVLVNALYFKGRWAAQFDENRTRDEPFQVAGKPINVPTMTKNDRFAYKRDKDIELLSIPYEGNRFAMMIVMPTGTASVEGIQKGLDAHRWEQWRTSLEPAYLTLSLPRFAVKPGNSIELKSAFQALGMRLPFDRTKADFRAMADPASPDELLYIAKIFHQSVVEVDEMGTEAAAATAVVMAARAGPPRPALHLKIDRPFLFSIYDKASGTMLFLGRVADPRG